MNHLNGFDGLGFKPKVGRREPRDALFFDSFFWASKRKSQRKRDSLSLLKKVSFCL